ncbi:hypothetical protein LWC33_16025 [Pseudonocardia sp. RS11V-5]|uniref:hypothetical protein n=1 Tax=Pseudonocardia terrae TaxID=2905831 RepID=UPI001E5DDDD0|nr:hypothetical protein [Pseudonocardia terrae]MCE3552958.1 hypothetical protein [Pseudonocardia terrae]
MTVHDAPVRPAPVGMARRPPPRPTPDVATVLGPFVAWLASREPHEGLRRRQVRVVERFLRWAAVDHGDPRTRRERFESEQDVAGTAEAQALATALDRFAEHRRILAIVPDLDA